MTAVATPLPAISERADAGRRDLEPQADGLVAALRRERQARFEVGATSTGEGFVLVEVGGRLWRVYDNANLSIYSAQTCNAHCPFCVEELRPLSRGVRLSEQKRALTDDDAYFEKLERALEAVEPLDPSVSITGGEPSRDPRLPRILALLKGRGVRKRTMTTNGSGLLEPIDPIDTLQSMGPMGPTARRDMLDAVLSAGLSHLNISRAHPDPRENQRVMRFDPFFGNVALSRILDRCREARLRVRLSCVLLRGVVDSLAGCLEYLDWAASMGVDNVVFRQLMAYDPSTVLANVVTRYTDRATVPLEPLLERIRPTDGGGGHPRFRFLRQVLGYYYYVEVYRYEGPNGGVDVCLEAADLAWIERDRQRRGRRDVAHELIFHPNGRLCSSWQPWDGVLV